MNKVYKISGATKVILTFGILLTLVIVGVFIYTCIKPAQAGDKLAGIIIMGIIMLMFVVLIIYCILALKDNVVLTDKGIKLHLLPQTFPYIRSSLTMTRSLGKISKRSPAFRKRAPHIWY